MAAGICRGGGKRKGGGDSTGRGRSVALLVCIVDGGAAATASYNRGGMVPAKGGGEEWRKLGALRRACASRQNPSGVWAARGAQGGGGGEVGKVVPRTRL